MPVENGAGYLNPRTQELVHNAVIALRSIYVLVHHDRHFGTSVDTFSTEAKALEAAEARLAEFSRYGPDDEERYEPKDDTRFNVAYGPEGDYVEVMRTTLDGES